MTSPSLPEEIEFQGQIIADDNIPTGEQWYDATPQCPLSPGICHALRFPYIGNHFSAKYFSIRSHHISAFVHSSNTVAMIAHSPFSCSLNTAPTVTRCPACCQLMLQRQSPLIAWYFNGIILRPHATLIALAQIYSRLVRALMADSSREFVIQNSAINSLLRLARRVANGSTADWMRILARISCNQDRFMG